MRKDLLHAARTLAKSPGFTALVVLSLALGIGANTAIFSVINATLLHPVPYDHPEQVMFAWSRVERFGVGDFPVSAPDFLDWRAQNRSFRALAAVMTRSANVTGIGPAERVRAARAKSDLFVALGMAPMLGRGLTPEDDRTGPPVVVLSYGFWMSRMGGARDVLGKTIQIDGAAHTVVGVMPPEFRFERVDLWRALTLREEDWMKDRGSHNLSVIGRLKPGVTAGQASADMSDVASHLAAAYQATNTGYEVHLKSIEEQTAGDVRPALMVLVGAVCLVLLIACANVANLLLTRASGRRREMNIRIALGATRWRIARLVLGESLLIAFAAGLAGWLLALWGIEGLLHLVPENLLPNAEGVGVHGSVLLFTLCVSILSGLAIGLGPALSSGRQWRTIDLKDGGRGSTTGVVRRRFRAMLAAGEVALSLVLLIGAGLLIKSFWQLIRIDPGFRESGVLTAGVVPSIPFDRTGELQNEYRAVLDRVSALPGVRAAAFASSLPLEGHNGYNSFEIEDVPRVNLTDMPIADETVITPEYFAVMGMRLLRGRGFTAADRAGSLPVVLVDEAAANKYWPEQNPVGKRLRYFKSATDMDRWLTVVGVVSNVKHNSMEGDVSSTVYLPLEQNPYPGMILVVATAGNPALLAQPVRALIAEIDPNTPVIGTRPMRGLVDDSLWRQRFAAQLVTLFAAIAVVLALVGAYGVLLNSVSQRISEFGVRIALGAAPGDVLQLVLREGAVLGGAGVGAGLVFASVGTRLLKSLLHNVGTLDASVYAGCSLLIFAAALLAAYVPARRAMTVDPIIALRCE